MPVLVQIQRHVFLGGITAVLREKFLLFTVGSGGCGSLLCIRLRLRRRGIWLRGGLRRRSGEILCIRGSGERRSRGRDGAVSGRIEIKRQDKDQKNNR